VDDIFGHGILELWKWNFGFTILSKNMVLPQHCSEHYSLQLLHSYYVQNLQLMNVKQYQ
jgi:hypothetical protein